MYALRRISLPAHAPVELSAGLALVVAALALSLGVSGTLALFMAGVILAVAGQGATKQLVLAGVTRTTRPLPAR